MAVAVDVLGRMDGGFEVVILPEGSAALGPVPRVGCPPDEAPAAVWARIEDLLVRVADGPWLDDATIEVTTYTDFAAAEADDIATAMRGFALPTKEGPVQ